MPHTNAFHHHSGNRSRPHAQDQPRVLVDGDGKIAPAPTDPAIAATGTGATPAVPVPTAAGASPFVINITYAAGVAAAPPAFAAGVRAAVQYLQSQFTDPVTINITIGFGEVAGTALGANALGISLTYLTRVAYTDIVAALAQDALTANDTIASGTLPATSPIPGGNYWISTANARAIGLAGPNTATDGYIGFSSTQNFDYDRSDGITVGAYDFFGTAMHEFTEVMGRMLLAGRTIGGTPNGYYPLDLFQYAAPGTRDFTAIAPGYFSPDGGKTNLGTFNTVAGGDAGDWGATMGNDAFNAFSFPGVINAVSNADLIVLDAIGWDRVIPVAATQRQPVVITGTAGNDTIDIAAHLGPPGTPTFISGLAGNDIVNGAGAASALWLSGGAGADRLTGGSGANTYQYGAASDSTARAMDIITNFNTGTDLLDLTAVSAALRFVGQIGTGKLAPGCIGWQSLGGSTFVYVNTSTRPERLTGTDMKIELLGNVALNGGNFAHG